MFQRIFEIDINVNKFVQTIKIVPTLSAKSIKTSAFAEVFIFSPPNFPRIYQKSHDFIQNLQGAFFFARV